MTDRAAVQTTAKTEGAWPAWVGALFEAIDASDADRFAEFLADDASFRFGNADAVQGKPAIREAVAGFFGSIGSVEHTLTGVWEAPGSLCCHGHSRYVRHDGSDLVTPFANVFYLAPDGKIVDYLIHIDLSALYQ